MRDSKLIGPQNLHPSRIFFNAEQAHGILEEASRTLTSKEVREELGVTEKVMADILGTGLIPRVENRADTRAYARIRKEDVEQFKAKIMAATTESSSGGLSTIRDVCQACGCSTTDVIALVTNAKLSSVTMVKSEAFRLNDLRVDLTEAVGLIVPARVAEWEKHNAGFIKLDDARVALQVKSLTISYLVQRGLIVVKKLTNPYTMRRQDYATLESIRAFEAEYIMLGELSKLYDTHPIVITTTMEKAGVKTSPERAGLVSRFYRRAEVDAHRIAEAVARLRK
ncbi:hypothetical protein ASG19_08640 [Rhizobium sp. Leaf306]|nr:hypothetical protein ASG19_08640 [Rhizobium sp. Leaf306]